jgi:hypothetical protein
VGRRDLDGHIGFRGVVPSRGHLVALAGYCRSVPLTTMSILGLPQCEHTSRSRQSGTVVSVPYRSAIPAGSGSAR